MPKITIHQEIWAGIRKFLIDSVVFCVALLTTVCLYKVESLIISYVLKNPQDEDILNKARKEVKVLCDSCPLYKDILGDTRVSV